MISSSRRTFLCFVASASLWATGCGSNNSNKLHCPGEQGCPDNTPLPECRDGIDNDGDGLIDYPNDPGCSSPNADSELDDCPNGPGCPECANHIDDDGNGLIDYPADPGCMAAGDYIEADKRPDCGPAMVIETMPTSLQVTATLDGTSSMATSSPCGGG